VGDADVKFQTVRRWQADGEPKTHVTLYQAVLKGDHFAWVLQKGTEVGVSAFVPMICERNVVDDLTALEGKRERWERIIREAAEQCGRGRLPELGAVQLFGQAVLPTPPAPLPHREGGEVRLIPWEGEHATTLRDALARCNFAARIVGSQFRIPHSEIRNQRPRIQVYIGPEGGFTEAEIALARRCGVQPITLGPRILRAETAGVIAAALILYEAGDI
jgi:16S rRNA (uracil1498-N3)-methyltransferase